MAGIGAKISNMLGGNSNTNDPENQQERTTGTNQPLGTGQQYGGTTGATSGTTGMTSGTTGVTGSSTGVTGGSTGGLVGGSGEVIDSKTFTKTEDHEVLIEKKAYELQHKPVQKEYVVETKFVGEQRVPGAASELVGTDERQVDERVVAAPAGDRAVVVENVDVPREALQQQTTTSSSGVQGTGSGVTGTGSGVGGNTRY